MENSLRQKRPAEHTLPKVLAEMDPAKREAGFRAFIKIAMERGAHRIRANPGIAHKQ